MANDKNEDQKEEETKTLQEKYDELLDVMKNYESDIEDQRTLRHETKNEFATIKCKLQDKEDNKTIIEYIDSVIGEIFSEGLYNSIFLT